MAQPGKFGWFLVASGLLSFYFLILPAEVSAAASLFVSPSTGTFIAGNTLTVSIYLNTGGQFVNAVDVNLSFPPQKLQVVSPSTGKSLVQVWISQPVYSNSEGTMRFQGAIPTPGINTGAGLISTIIFRVRETGPATLKILSSSKVLLNDGLGTDILGQTTDGVYYLALPPPAGPIVASPTNPDQGKWYAVKNVVFQWDVRSDTEGFSYVLNDNPVDVPDDVSVGLRDRVSYSNLADGTHYFHIKSLRGGVWGGVTTYVVRIDNTPPASFTINFSPASRTANHRPIIDFGTTDSASGINHYELRIIPLDPPLALAAQNNTPFFIEAIPPYSAKLDDGRYMVVVRAYDEAGNYTQSEADLTITKPLFVLMAGRGLRIGDTYILSWPYVLILALALLLLLGYFARLAWRWHRQIEEYLRQGVSKHPAVAEKLEELKEKQKEYGGSSGSGAGGKRLMALLLTFALGLAFLLPRLSLAEQDVSSSMPLEPPIVTLFPKSISNDEILYIGGRAAAPQANVLVRIQQIETGSAMNAVAPTDKTGAWFYSFPQFLDTGHYIVWTQLKVGEALSPPSSRMDLLVAPTAIQIGKNRLSYQDLYLALLLIFIAAFLGLSIFSLYHAYHLRLKNRRLNQAVRDAEESVRRGFSVLRRDIESELTLVRRAKLGKDLSQEEKLREEKLLKDLGAVNGYIGKEIWEIERES